MELKDSGITHLLQSSLFESADFGILQHKIKKNFGIDLSIDELKKLSSFQQLFDKIKSDNIKTNTL